MSKTTREKKIRGLSIVPILTGEPTTSEMLQDMKNLDERRRQKVAYWERKSMLYCIVEGAFISWKSRGSAPQLDQGKS